MIETELPASADPKETQVSAFDAASYIFQLSREMASMADERGLSKLAAALELTRDLAAEALVTHAQTVQSSPENAAPDDAA
jgi:hypothetical protein